MSSTIKRALISVYDKTGIVDFAKSLSEGFGIEILSTGGTAKLLAEKGIPVTLVEEVTGSGEMLDGRVKTLHPKIHAGILADRDNPDHMRQLAEAGIEPIDMVVVNLYPFEETIARPDCTFAEAIEMIDIGGPCMLRAAAKNCRHVLVCHQPRSYSEIVDALQNGDKEHLRHLRLDNAQRAFLDTSVYDSHVGKWLTEQAPGETLGNRMVRLLEGRELRYGENPHQTGTYFGLFDDRRLNALACDVSGAGVDLSYNNYADASAALELCGELSHAHSDSCVCVFIKHTNACGAAVDRNPIDAYRRAYLGDTNAAMGGILAVNFSVDCGFAETVMNTYQNWGKERSAGGFFVEVWLAPSFIDDNVVKSIRESRNWGSRVRLLDHGHYDSLPGKDELRYAQIVGGMLVQSLDDSGLKEEDWKIVTKRRPTETEMADLRLAWLVCKHTKSNAISICKDGMLIGNGAGQMSRVMSCRIATWLAKENGHEAALAGSVAASDAFFPFRDGPDILVDAGVTAIIQPGGSKRDEDTVAACDERGVAMVFTGTRHFKH